MSNLSIDQKTVLELFSAKDAVFLIPDYQRPYAWGDQQCQTLWDDIFSFSLPDNNCDAFKQSSEYFLGSIVTFRNGSNKEIIDGQQRLTTLLLLLRAFYARFGNMNDNASISTKKAIESCIWKVDEFDSADKNSLKISSEVVDDDERDEFVAILKTGNILKGYKSRYARNYKFFLDRIDEFKTDFPTYYAFLPNRIMKNCILLPIEAESQDTALRIFSTLNDRGMPLSDSDIFKAQFYKYYSSLGTKKKFVQEWKELEAKANKIFHPIYGNSMDDLFTRYMYYVRAKQGIKQSTTEALRKFYEKESYAILKEKDTFPDLQSLARFWEDVSNQEEEKFSERVLKRLFVLKYAPNGMWIYFVSVYFMHNRDCDGGLDDEKFYKFLNMTTAFVWAYSFMRPGVNALRTPIYAEMIKIINDETITFDEYKFDETILREQISNFEFYNRRPITKSMITWWAFNNPQQKLLRLETAFDTEHIFPVGRQKNEKSLKNPLSIEKLGNKSILEKRINIRASDYRFADKKKYYTGYVTTDGQNKAGTEVRELLDMASNYNDFREDDINERNKMIIDTFIDFVRDNNLIK